MWNEEPYSANLIPVIFVFTFIYSIILYAFSKVIEDNMLVLNCMIKTTCLRSDRGVIEENVLYHCLWHLNINSYNLRSDRVIEDLQKTWFFVTFGAGHVLKLVSLLPSKVMLALLNISDLKGQFIYMYMLEDTFLLWFRILVQLPW